MYEENAVMISAGVLLPCKILSTLSRKRTSHFNRNLASRMQETLIAKGRNPRHGKLPAEITWRIGDDFQRGNK